MGSPHVFHPGVQSTKARSGAKRQIKLQFMNRDTATQRKTGDPKGLRRLEMGKIVKA
jgi:hypothetical protein